MANRNRDTGPDRQPPSDDSSRSIDWYAEGDSRVVDVGGVHVEVRFVGRKGRKARIAITAPPGARFCSPIR